MKLGDIKAKYATFSPVDPVYGEKIEDMEVEFQHATSPVYEKFFSIIRALPDEEDPLAKNNSYFKTLEENLSLLVKRIVVQGEEITAEALCELLESDDYRFIKSQLFMFIANFATETAKEDKSNFFTVKKGEGLVKKKK